MPVLSSGNQQSHNEVRRILAGPHRHNPVTGRYEALPGVVVPPAKVSRPGVPDCLSGQNHWVPGAGHDPGHYAPGPDPAAKPAAAAKPAKK